MTFENAALAFEARSIAANHSETTIRLYSMRLRLFGEYLRARGVERVEDVTPALIREYIGGLFERGLSPFTVHQTVRILKTFFHYLHDEELIPANPSTRVQKPILPELPFPVFSDEDIRKMLDVCRPIGYLGIRNGVIIQTLISTGIRAAELCTLNVDGVNLRDGYITVFGKGRKTRVIPIRAEFKGDLVRYLAIRAAHLERCRLLGYEVCENAAFLTNHGGRLRVHGLTQQIGKIGARAGVEDARSSPHTFRHTFATNWIKAGGDLFSLQQILGHTTLEMVRRYVSLAAADIAKKQQRYGMDLLSLGRRKK